MIDCFQSTTMKSPFLFLLLLSHLVIVSMAKSIIPEGYYRGDPIVTKWPAVAENSSPPSSTSAGNSSSGPVHSNEPGWMRKQLLKFGQVASKIGNAMGSHANKITAALDKICEVVKTVIPLLAAVCHVGDFGFCAATDAAPIKLSEAMNPSSLDLDSLDR